MGADCGFGAAGSQDKCSPHGHSPALSGSQHGHSEVFTWPRLDHTWEGAVFQFALPQQGSLRLETSWGMEWAPECIPCVSLFDLLHRCHPPRYFQHLEQCLTQSGCSTKSLNEGTIPFVSSALCSSFASLTLYKWLLQETKVTKPRGLWPLSRVERTIHWEGWESEGGSRELGGGVWESCRPRAEPQSV